MSLVCDGVLEDKLPCNGSFEETDKFCKACGKRKDKVRKTLEPKAVHHAFDTHEDVGADNAKDIMPGQVSESCYGEKKEENAKKQDVRKESAGKGNTFDLNLPKCDPSKSESEMREIEELFRRSGTQKLREYVKRKNEEWKETPLHIGVTGLSGVGKSSFINAIRVVGPGHELYADVGVDETTTKVTPYYSPENPSLIFWDMPGAGTDEYPREGYFKKVGFDKFDFFLILFHKRYHEDINWFAKHVKSLGKTCLFIRTHIHVDVKNDKKRNPHNHSPDHVLDRIRENFLKKLKENDIETAEVFLIDNNKTGLYEFDKLTTRLIYEIPDLKKREAFVLSLSAVSESVINEKKKALEKRIKRVALLSAVAGAVPVPGIGAAVDIILLREEAQEYRKQFGLTEDVLRMKFSESSPIFIDLRDKYAMMLAGIIVVITADEAAETVLRCGIPFIGSLLSGTLSYGVAVASLKRILNELAEDARKVNKSIITLETSV